MNVSTVSIKKNGRSSFTGSNLSLRHNNKNHLKSKEFLAGNDNIKYRRTKLTQIDVNSSNYAEIIRLTSLLDEAYAKIKDLTSENKKLLTNQRVQERALKNTNEMVGDYPKTIEKLMEDIRVLKAQNKKYVEKLVSIERAQSKKVAIQNSTDNNYELKEKNHILHEELEKVKQKMVAYKKNNENYQKIYDQLIKRTKFCKEKVAENKILVQKNQKMEKDIIKLRESYEILKKKVRSQGNNSYDKNKTTSLKYGINKNEYEKNSNDHDSIRRSRDTLNKKPARNEINKPKKALNSNEVHQVIKKQAERKQQPLKLKSNFNNHKENNSSNDRNIIKKSNPNINIKNNCNESEENYKEIYSDDFDVIEDEDQKFFIPSQEESLKPSTLYKPNLYYSANCSPEPEIKNDNDNLSINEVLNEETNDNEKDNINVNNNNNDIKEIENNNDDDNNNEIEINNDNNNDNNNNNNEIDDNNNDNTIEIGNNNNNDHYIEINNNKSNNNINNNNIKSDVNNENGDNYDNNIEIDTDDNDNNNIENDSNNNNYNNNEIDNNNKNDENNNDIINENNNEDNNENNNEDSNSNKDTNNEYSEDGNYYSDKFEEISFIDEKIDTEIPSSETTKSEILNEKNNQELDNSHEIVEEKLEANKYENNNSASIFDDHYYEDFYNDYAEENIKLNDNILNIDEYISNDITNMYKSQEENMLDKNNNIDNKNNGNISYSNMDENDDDDSLSFNNYNVLDLLK